MSNVLNIEEIMQPDHLANHISNQYQTWESFRQIKISEWEEIQRYIFATDTTKTSNAKLPWSNKTTIPKLCQIRDNLFANYMATMFPKKKNVEWQGYSEDDNTKETKTVIEEYMCWVQDQPHYMKEIAKCVLDFIDYGNVFGIPEWFDGRSLSPESQTKVGFVGPRIRRISPLDIVFDPTASSFDVAPKIIRSLISMGEVKEMLDRDSKTEEEKKDAQELYNYLRDLRVCSVTYNGNQITKDAIYQIAGFDSFQNYLASNTVEVLTFYGDLYDEESDKFMRNQIIKIVDRHKIISQIDNPSFFGSPPVYHVGWRIRPDNLWAMGPLDNLVGMQYRIDHLENIKSDVFDLIAYPPLKVKGYVDDFEWGPMERIICYDDSDVELMSPQVQAMQADTQIQILETKMEEMAGSPKEAMGFRTPGEKTKYEVQRLENAASRIFQNKINQFEMHFIEPLLNAMLELARRYMDETTIYAFDPNYKIDIFKTLTPQDLTGNGRLRPVASRHFAEKSQLVQDLNNFFASPAGHDPMVLMHFSGIKLANLWNELLDIEEYDLVEPYIRITEQADAQHLNNVAQEGTNVASSTPSGIGADADPTAVAQAQAGNAPPIPASLNAGTKSLRPSIA